MSPIHVELGRYEQTVRDHVHDFVLRYNAEADAHLSAQVDYDKLYTLLAGVGYPQARELVNAIQSGDPTATELLKQYYLWRQGKPIPDADAFMDLVSILKMVQNQLRGPDAKIPQQREEEWARAVLGESLKNLGAMKQSVEQAVHRVQTWHGSQVVIRPRIDERNVTDPVTSASVVVGNSKADFTLFYNDGSIAVDDVLDWGDTDFFTDEATQTDYFSLVREIENPGGKSGKPLVLYTARPAKDREMYQQAADSGQPWVPAGIFLANDPDHVAGLAVDFGGERDIWRVKIDANKVRLTNDTPRIKYYQVVGAGKVPVKSLHLA